MPEKAGLLGLEDPLELVSRAGEDPALRGRFRLLSCTGIGGAALLAAFRPDSAVIDGRPRQDLLVAVSGAAEGDGFEGII